MKSLLLIIVGIVIGMCLHSMNNVSTQTTYNNKGTKTIVSTCDKDKDCIISVGQECSDSGYKIISTDHDDMKTIITAECGKDKNVSFGLL